MGSNYEHIHGNETPNLHLSIDISKNGPIIESYGLSNRGVETDVLQCSTRRFQNAIMGSGQTFPNVYAFRDALYLMSLSRRFRYYYKRNTYKHITVICTVTSCPWKITCRAVGALDVVQVHTFRNEHSHIVDDVVASQPVVRSNQAVVVIGEVIRSTPEYQPQQICKDFVGEHGMRLTYYQAWQIKDKAKERIYGQPKNYYKLLPWMCERKVQSNPR